MLLAKQPPKKLMDILALATVVAAIAATEAVLFLCLFFISVWQFKKTLYNKSSWDFHTIAEKPKLHLVCL